MLVETFRSDGRQLQIQIIIIDKCVIKRKQWLLKPKQIKTIRNNESLRNHRKFHVKQFNRWPAVQCHHHHVHCTERWTCRHQTPMVRHHMHQLKPVLAATIQSWARCLAHSKKNQTLPKINRTLIESFIITITGKHTNKIQKTNGFSALALRFEMCFGVRVFIGCYWFIHTVHRSRQTNHFISTINPNHSISIRENLPYRRNHWTNIKVCSQSDKINSPTTMCRRSQFRKILVSSIWCKGKVHAMCQCKWQYPHAAYDCN